LATHHDYPPCEAIVSARFPLSEQGAASLQSHPTHGSSDTRYVPILAPLPHLSPGYRKCPIDEEDIFSEFIPNIANFISWTLKMAP